jgi:hypothetical protein
MTYTLPQVRKAAVGAAITAVAALGAAMLDGGLTQVEALGSLGMGLVAFGAVFKVKNAE